MFSINRFSFKDYFTFFHLKGEAVSLLTGSYKPVPQNFLINNNGKTGITFPSDREADLKIITS